MSLDWVSHEFARLIAEVGIAPCTLRDLRRSFNAAGWRAGADDCAAKDLGGRSCVSVVEKHYTGDVVDVCRQAMDTAGGAS